MVIARSGTLGTYYGSTYDSSSAITSESQLKVNAYYIYKYFKSLGWSINAIAGMLGNFHAESSLNPGRWQSDNVGATSSGYGLVQWTPASNYIEWCDGYGFDPSEMDNNLNRILYEFKNDLQWIPTNEYNYTFVEFSTMTGTPEYLALIFLKCYERAGVENLSYRQEKALLWYEYLLQFEDGSTPDIPDDSGTTTTKIKKKRFKFHLFKRKVKGITR